MYLVRIRSTESPAARHPGRPTWRVGHAVPRSGDPKAHVRPLRTPKPSGLLPRHPSSQFPHLQTAQGLTQAPHRLLRFAYASLVDFLQISNVRVSTRMPKLVVGVIGCEFEDRSPARRKPLQASRGRVSDSLRGRKAGTGGSRPGPTRGPGALPSGMKSSPGQ